MILKKIHQEIVLIRKELQAIRRLLEPKPLKEEMREHENRSRKMGGR